MLPDEPTPTKIAEEIVPVVAETVEISKRTFDTELVRVRTEVQAKNTTVRLPHAEERIDVERVLMQRMVDAPPGVRQEGDTTIISLVEEVVVWEKRLVVREEIRLTRRRVETVREVPIVLRSEVATVERVPSKDREGAPTTARTETFGATNSNHD